MTYTLRDWPAFELLISDETLQMLQLFDRALNLKSVALVVREKMDSTSIASLALDHWRDANGHEHFAKYFAHLENSIHAIIDTLSRPAAQAIDHLALQGLPAFPYRPRAHGFGAVLSRLRTLKFSINAYEQVHRQSIARVSARLKSVMQGFPSLWLQPASANLTRLHLCFDWPARQWPQLDLQSIHLPKLETLALGKLYFSHDWQLDWIISHAPTLKHLALVDCRIMVVGIARPEPADPPAFRPERFTTLPEGWQCWRYDRRWSDAFARFRTELPLLRTFKFGAEDPSRAFPYVDDLFDDVELGVCTARHYACFRDFGYVEFIPDHPLVLLPAEDAHEAFMRMHWAVFGAVPPPEHGFAVGDDGVRDEEHRVDLADRRALVELLVGIGQRLPPAETGRFRWMLDKEAYRDCPRIEIPDFHGDAV